jgi:SAM-dependent methyltransferase
MEKKSESYLKDKIHHEISQYYFDINSYPQEKYNLLLKRWSDDSFYSEKQRFDLLERMIPDVKNKKILDMASGCGSFVIQGLIKGWNTYGVEPEEWKQTLIDIKFEENNYPQEWRHRMVTGIGEKLPFENESFDCFDSWQTIEHVQSEEACIKELYRVLKKGGQGILRGPDYFSFFEGHYMMFWFPLMGDSKFSRWYLKLRNRPAGGLDTFHPVNPFKLKKYCRDAGFTIIDIKQQIIYDAAKRKMPFLSNGIFKPVLRLIYFMWDAYMGIKNFGRSEATISFLLVKN